MTVDARAAVTRWWAGEGGAPGSLLRAALAPAEWGFRRAVARRNAGFDRGERVERVSVPVVSVGNLAVGGAGKTPFAAFLAARLESWGRRPAIATRGYGGDEVLLHRELNPTIPVFAAARRVEAARQAEADGRDVVVLDDGFQHRFLARDLDVVLVAAETWTRTPHLLPRGPWREGPESLARAGAVVVTRKTAEADRADAVAREVAAFAGDAPVAVAALRPARLAPLHGGAARAIGALRGRRVLATAALADPAPFLRHLRDAGARVEDVLFGDHHAFSASDAAGLARRAGGDALVMTRKDAVKLRPLLSRDLEAYVLDQTVVVERGEAALDAALRRAVEGRG